MKFFFIGLLVGMFIIVEYAKYNVNGFEARRAIDAGVAYYDDNKTFRFKECKNIK